MLRSLVCKEVVGYVIHRNGWKKKRLQILGELFPYFDIGFGFPFLFRSNEFGLFTR